MSSLVPGPRDQTLRWLSTFPGPSVECLPTYEASPSTYRSHEKRRRPPACRFTWIRNALSRIDKLPHRRSPEHEVIRGHDDRAGPLHLGEAVDVGKYDGSANRLGLESEESKTFVKRRVEHTMAVYTCRNSCGISSSGTNCRNCILSLTLGGANCRSAVWSKGGTPHTTNTICGSFSASRRRDRPSAHVNSGIERGPENSRTMSRRDLYRWTVTLNRNGRTRSSEALALQSRRQG